MNRPGTTVGNWRWRLEEGQLTAALAARLRAATERAGRSSGRQRRTTNDRFSLTAFTSAEEPLSVSSSVAFVTPRSRSFAFGVSSSRNRTVPAFARTVVDASTILTVPVPDGFGMRAASVTVSRVDFTATRVVTSRPADASLPSSRPLFAIVERRDRGGLRDRCRSACSRSSPRAVGRDRREHVRAEPRLRSP